MNQVVELPKLTPTERRAARRAADMIANGKETFSCVALKFALRKIAGKKSNHFGLRDKYKFFCSQRPESMLFYFSDGEALRLEDRETRILALLLFAEACK